MSEIKQPTDHKQPADEPYEWKAPDGRIVTFKPFGKLPVGVFRKARAEGNEMEQTFQLLEAGTDAAGLEVLDDLPISELDQVFEGWAAASGVEPGESLGSSTSSTSIEEPSSTTGAPGSDSA